MCWVKVRRGGLGEWLEEAEAPAGQDWALAWTLEELESADVREERAGWFGTVERAIFALDPFGGRGADPRATRTQRAILLPQRPFQVPAASDPPRGGPWSLLRLLWPSAPRCLPRPFW